MSRKDKTLRSTKKRRTKKRRTKKTRTKKTRRRSKARQEGGGAVVSASVIKSELIHGIILYAFGQLIKQGDKKCVKYAESMEDESFSDDIKSCRELSQRVLKDFKLGIKNYSKKWPKVFLKNLKEEFNIPDKNLSTIKGIKEFYNTVRRAKEDGNALKILEAFKLTNEEVKKDKSVTSPNRELTDSSLSKIYKGIKDKTGFGKDSESPRLRYEEDDTRFGYDEYEKAQAESILDGSFY